MAARNQDTNWLSNLDLSYRRGVLLGMTMAEIMILLLFCILMAFVLRLDDYEDDIDNYKSAKAFEEALVSSGAAPSIDDAWNIISSTPPPQLIQVIETVKKVSETLTDDLNREPTGEELQREISAAQEAYKRNKEVSDAIDLLHTIAGREEVAAAELADYISEVEAKAEAWDRTQSGMDLKDLEELMSENQQLKNQLDRLDRALVVAETQLSDKGNGLVYPSCFVNDSGKPQYIYDVLFSENVLELKERLIIGYESDLDTLPLSDVTVDEQVTYEKFLGETQALYDWSYAKRCRFFVVVYDQTAPENKAQYKSNLRMIERHFYKFESNEAFTKL